MTFKKLGLPKDTLLLAVGACATHGQATCAANRGCSAASCRTDCFCSSIAVQASCNC